MRDLHHKHHSSVILKLAENAIVSNTIAPYVIQLSLQLLSPLARVFCAKDTVIKKIDDPLVSFRIEFFE